jgi:tetratricopeptide repeat protein
VRTRAIGSCLALAIGAAVIGALGQAEDDSVVGAARVYVKAAQEARKAGRPQAALDALIAAYALRPHHGGVAFELGAAYAAAGRLEEAAETLQVVAAMGFPFGTEEREELRACRSHPACGAALAAIARNRQPKITSTVAFTFAGSGLVPEGLAHDPRSDSFFVSSVRRRLILKVDRSRTPRTFADRSAGLWAALGMAVDVPRRRLWVATAALPEMEDGAAADKGRSGLVALDLDTGRAVARYELPGDRPHVLGDVIVTPAGDVLTTDSTSPAIYRLPAAGGTLETVAAGEPFVSLQGLALAADGTRLFVADYAKGLFAIDLALRRVRLLDAPRNAGILGIDGLYRAGDALLGIQNGTDPPRLLRLVVDGDRITSVDVLDAGHPAATDPTLGVVVGDHFHYIGNSQWSAAKAGGEMDPAVTPEDPVILGLTLTR